VGTGDVLVTSGYNAGFLSDTEIYDPTANTWTQAAPLPPDPRYGGVAAPLANGTVLVTFGYDPTNGPDDDSEIYSPATSTGATTTSVSCSPASVVAGQPTSCRPR
jgi:hypothetical protein